MVPWLTTPEKLVTKRYANTMVITIPDTTVRLCFESKPPTNNRIANRQLTAAM
jgi:hypothetical protein